MGLQNMQKISEYLEWLRLQILISCLRLGFSVVPWAYCNIKECLLANLLTVRLADCQSVYFFSLSEYLLVSRVFVLFASISSQVSMGLAVWLFVHMYLPYTFFCLPVRWLGCLFNCLLFVCCSFVCLFSVLFTKLSCFLQF